MAGETKTEAAPLIGRNDTSSKKLTFIQRWKQVHWGWDLLALVLLAASVTLMLLFLYPLTETMAEFFKQVIAEGFTNGSAFLTAGIVLMAGTVVGHLVHIYFKDRFKSQNVVPVTLSSTHYGSVPLPEYTFNPSQPLPRPIDLSTQPCVFYNLQQAGERLEGLAINLCNPSTEDLRCLEEQIKPLLTVNHIELTITENPNNTLQAKLYTCTFIPKIGKLPVKLLAEVVLKLDQLKIDPRVHLELIVAAFIKKHVIQIPLFLQEDNKATQYTPKLDLSAIQKMPLIELLTVYLEREMRQEAEQSSASPSYL